MQTIKKMVGLTLWLSVAFALSFGFSGGVSAAAEDDLADFYGDEEFINIATGFKQLIHQAPSTASVITAEDIETMGAADIDEVLESVAGLHVSYSVVGLLPHYIFRGISSGFNPQVLMLINGIPITNLLAGDRSQLWGGMPVKAIERMEIIRGPGSALYGADAFAGVINIITKDYDSLGEPDMGMRLGSYNSKDFWWRFKHSSADFKTAITLQKHISDGYAPLIETDRQTFFDQLFQTNASLAPARVNNQRDSLDFRIDLLYKNWRFRSGLQRRINSIGVGFAHAIVPNPQSKSRRFNSDLSYKKQSVGVEKQWDLDLQVSFFNATAEIDHDSLLFPAGADIGLGGVFPDGVIGAPEQWEEHYRFNAKAKYKGFEQHLFDIGVGYAYRDLYRIKERKNFAFGPNGEFLVPGSAVVDVSDTPFVFLQEGDRINQYVFIQDVWSFANDWQATSGLRYDHYSGFGSTLNPRFALVWSSSLNVTTKLLYGRAFRAPSFAETGNINNPVALGNPNLKPERIETIDFAVAYRASHAVHIDINFYRSHWRDIIQFVADSNAASNTAQNVGSQRTYGFEIEFDWQLTDNLGVKGNFSQQSSTDQITGAPAPLVPTKQLYVMVDWQSSEKLKLQVRANRVMGRVRSSFDPRTNIKDYTLVDLTAHWQAPVKDLTFKLALKNLFDQDAREPTPIEQHIDFDLPLAGRNAYLELAYYY